VHTVKRYVEEMKDGQSLLDVLAISGEDMMDVSKPSGSGKKSALYPEVCTDALTRQPLYSLIVPT
jgi:hypothetical protein